MAGGRGGRQRENADGVELGDDYWREPEKTSVTSPLRVRRRRRATGTPACPHCPAMGHQLGGTGLCQPAGRSHSDVIYCLAGVLQLACRGKPLLLQLRGLSLSCKQRQWHPVPSPREGAPGTPCSGEEVAPSPPAGPAVGFCKVLAPIKAFQ